MAKKTASERDGEKADKVVVNIDSIDFRATEAALSNLKPADRLMNNRTSIVRRLLPSIEEAKKRGVSVETIACRCVD